MKPLILAATEFELAVLVESLQCTEQSRLLDFTVYRAPDSGPVLMRCGPGMANAAAATALGITLFEPDHIFNVGVCGIYNGGTEILGRVFTGTRAVFADTGIDSGSDFSSMQAIDLPLAKLASGERVFNVIELHAARTARSLKRAVFLTIAAGSGNQQRAALLSSRFKLNSQETLCEDMESAAVALIACKAAVPCTVVRGISNVCGDRDYANWKLSEAAQSAQKELLKCL